MRSTPITPDLVRGAVELLQHLDGRELYGEADAARLPLPDQLHPDAETHRMIGERFAGHPLLR